MLIKVVYHAYIENDINNEQKFFFGVSETPSKKCLGNHKKKISIANTGIAQNCRSKFGIQKI